MAQLVARDVWDVDAAGSNPVTPTISSVHNTSELWTLDFFLPVFTFSLIFSFFEQFFCSFLFVFSFVILRLGDTLLPRLGVNRVYRYVLV